MDEAGILPTSVPARRWCLGAEPPLADPATDLPAALLAPLKECADGPPDQLPADYGDPDGLWITIRRRNPFDVLLLDGASELSLETILVRFRVLWKFWTQKLAISRQGATRTAVRKKYGDEIESFVDHLQWAYDQLSVDGGVLFWRRKIAEERSQTLWAGIADVVEATLADGLLDASEIAHLIARAERLGYEREEFATALRDVLHTRRFEPEIAPSGEAASVQLASVRWATPDVWARIRATEKSVALVPAERYYIRIRQTGEVIGPIHAGHIGELARARTVGFADEVCLVGASVWQPIAHSQFGHNFQPQVTPYSYVCPRCGQTLMLVSESSAAGWVVLVIGVVTAWFFIGIPLVLIGLLMLLARTKTQRWRCVQCGYVS